MHRNVADGRIALDQRLSAVPMVYVPVHDQDAGLVELLRVPRSDDDVVDETESHRARREGVMSGRTGGGEGRARHDRPLHGTDGYPRRRDGRVPAVGAHHRVGIEHPAALTGHPLEAVEVARRMHTLQRRPACRPRLAPRDAGGHVRCAQRVEHRHDALGTLRMAGPGVMAFAGGVEEDGNGHRGGTRSWVGTRTSMQLSYAAACRATTPELSPLPPACRAAPVRARRWRDGSGAS